MVAKIFSGLTLVGAVALASMPAVSYAENEKHGYRHRYENSHERFHDRLERQHDRYHRPQTHPFYYRHDNRPYRYYDNRYYDNWNAWNYQPYSSSYYYRDHNDGCTFVYGSHGQIILACH